MAAGAVQQADDMLMMTSPLSSNNPLLLPDPRASTQCAQKPEPSNPKGKASPYPQLLWHGARSSGEGYPDSPRASCGTMHGSGTALGHGGIDGEPDTVSCFARHAAKPDFPYVVVAPRSASSLGTHDDAKQSKGSNT